LQIYIDDIIFGSTNQDFCEEFRKMMANEFEMSMIRELSYFLGLQIKQLKNGTFVSRGKYIKNILKKFRMEDAKAISTPMGTNGRLDSDVSGNMVDQKMYQSIIGSLLYMTASRPDVMFSVCMCARFQASPRESHLKATKRILRYLKHTQSVRLWYLKGAKFELIGIQTLIMRDAKLREESHWAHVNYREYHLFLSHQRSKIVLHFQPPKLNTLPPVVVVHKFFG
jgi:hypothetical protein